MDEKNMDTKSTIEHPDGCRCCGCMHGGFMYSHWHHRFFWLRWIIGIVVLLAVFAIGVKLGELKSLVGPGDYEYGRGMMWNQPYMYRTLPPRDEINQTPSSATAPSASATPSTAK